MRILAIDTATEACSAAVLVGGSVVSRNLVLGAGAAERILGLVDEVLAEAGVALRALDAVAFGRGPGSFTGVRLAASITQGLAFAAELPVIAISDLQAVAQQVIDSAKDIDMVLVCSDARMREVYWGCYRPQPAGAPLPVVAERVGPPASVALPSGSGRAQGAGSGFAAYPELASRLGPQLTAGIAPGLLPRAQDIAHLAALELRSGRTLAPDQAIPIYLRDDVAAPSSQD